MEEFVVDAEDAVYCVVSRGLLCHDGWKLLGDVGVQRLMISVLLYPKAVNVLWISSSYLWTNDLS